MGVVQHPASCPHPEQGALQACPPPAAQPAATAPRAGLGQPPDPPRLRGPGPLRLPMCLPHTPSPSVPPDSLLLTTAGPGGEAAAVTWRSDPVIPPFLETVRTKTAWLWASQPKQGDGKRGEFRAGAKKTVRCPRDGCLGACAIIEHPGEAPPASAHTGLAGWLLPS